MKTESEYGRNIAVHEADGGGKAQCNRRAPAIRSCLCVTNRIAQMIRREGKILAHRRGELAADHSASLRHRDDAMVDAMVLIAVIVWATRSSSVLQHEEQHHGRAGRAREAVRGPSGAHRAAVSARVSRGIDERRGGGIRRCL